MERNRPVLSAQDPYVIANVLYAGFENGEVARVQLVDIRADVHTNHMRRDIRQKVALNLVALLPPYLGEWNSYALPQTVQYRRFSAKGAQ